MYNGMMMDPEMIRIAQEQMSRMSPQDFARIQQQMLSNPELIKLASESMKNIRPDDIKMAAEQLKNTRPEEIAEIGEKMAKASPDEIAAMRAHAEAQASYELNAAQMLKQQGNEFHSHGKFRDAAEKYLLAKNNLKNIPLSKCRTLQTQCSLNLMSCYLKTRQFDECIEEGSQVLAYDSTNVKALYRRGQAYKEIGKLEAAVSDLRKAHDASPDDETVADAWRDANDKLMKGGVDQNKPRGVIIEEIVEDDKPAVMLEGSSSSSAEHVGSTIPEVGNHLRSSNGLANGYGGQTAENEYLQKLKDDPESIRLFQGYVANTNPESMAAFGAKGMPPEMIKTATNMIKNMKPDELQKMLQVASSMNMKNPIDPAMVPDNKIGPSRLGSGFPELSPEMMKLASEKLAKMSPDELQKMVEAASSLNLNSSSLGTITSNMNDGGERMDKQYATACNYASETSSRSKNTSDLQDSGVGPSSSSPPMSAADLQETMRNSMRDPAMLQMFSSMMKGMSPELMANMSEQFGVKLSKEDAAKAQQAMSSLSPDDLERMMRWVERAQKGVETARKTKNWLLGKPGMILAICMLILAIILHWLGFIGG